jgi:NAD(P)H-dependent FMN reductase
MRDSALRLAVIVGSVRVGRFAPAVRRWLEGQLATRDDFVTDLIDLADVELPINFDGSGDAETYCKRIADADAFVVITPEYNHAFPGPLKTAIDTANEGWNAKPVALVSYGGVSGGLRAVEQLRLVFAELQAVTMRETVSFHLAHEQFDDDGTLVSPERANVAAHVMLDQLKWWATALRAARAGAIAA